MFLIRRLVWFTTGATAGFGGAMWIRRQVRRRVERLVPQRVAADAGVTARKAGRGLLAAVEEGRRQARGREAELRAELRPGSTAPVVTAPGAAGPARPGPSRLSHQGRRAPYR
jgi:hypothetical protein